MHIRTQAIVCAVRAHAENDVIARLMTPSDGLVAGYVRGGRSRRLRPVLLPGNIVAAEFRARSEDQLAGLTVELTHSRSALHAEPLAAAAIEWLTALTAATLPEGHPYPRIHAALKGVLAAIEAAPSARGWIVGLARYELLLLADLGFGGEDFSEVLRGVDAHDWSAILAALRATGDQLAEHLFAGHRADVMAARGRLIDRLKRAVP